MRADFGFLIAILAVVGCSGGGDGETSARESETLAQETVLQQQSSGDEQSDAWKEAVKGLDERSGFLTLYVGNNENQLLAAFPAPDDGGVALRAIHAAGLTAGLGSNPIGLDRGLFDDGSLIVFRKVGDKLIAEQENWNYRASAENPLEKRAVRESFAASFIWAGEIIAHGANGELLVDFTEFATRDALSVRQALKDHPGGGDFSIAADRTMPDFENILVFPDNIEIDAYLTLVSETPKGEVNATAADARAVTLVQHHSLIRLPDDGYTPRAFDPRSGSIDVPYYDFSAPLDGKVKNAFARRFRLRHEDPANPESPAKNPIIFYVDAGAPEEIRDALIEGASWWRDAFAAAGFPDGYRVEVMPADAHPRDIRYNTILWTHRQTRGWSYGGGVHDPRTGEMLKANVILGSQRVRQDRMIFEGLTGAAASGTGAPNDPVVVALNRIKQLSAHEVGHTLGFAHNFAASSNDRASVMDYPAPYVKVGDNGNLDLSQAYDDGIGEWDKVAAAWLYTEFAEQGAAAEGLEKILADGYGAGLRFIGDREARSLGTAHPYASVWDNGGDAVASLEEVMDVRRVALENFGARSIRDGAPESDLREVIVPIYLYHRYQIAAAAKLVGGFDFSYSAKGDALAPGQIVPDTDQRRALDALAMTLDPSILNLPDELVDSLTPPLGTFGAISGGGEVFGSEIGPVFDLLSAADSAGALTIGALLHPDRAARLVDYQSREPSRLGLTDVLRRIEQTVFANQSDGRERAIAQRLQTRFVSEAIRISAGAAATGEVQAAARGLSNGGGAIATSEVQAIMDAYLKSLRARIAPGLLEGQSQDRAHREWLIAKIDRHLNRPALATITVVSPPETPPGSPIGSSLEILEPCWHCDPLPQ